MFAQVDELDVQALSELADSEAWSRPSQLFLKNQALAEVHRIRSGSDADPAGRFWGHRTSDGVTYGAFFGGTRVVCLGPGTREDGARLRRVAVTAQRGFRIVIGSREPTIGLLRAIQSRIDTQLERSQPFLVVEDAARVGEGIDARVAGVDDVPWLVEASIRLNEEDLGIPARSVDRKLLQKRVGERVAEGSTWLVDRDGGPVCKLEIGNDGPAGALVEGVYTAKDYRGKGYARRLCAEVASRMLQDRCRIGLHVGRENESARKAYHAAGFTEVEDLVLALVNWI